MGRSVGDSFGRFQSGNPQSLGFSNGQFVPVTRGVLLGAVGDAASVDAELQEPGTFRSRRWSHSGSSVTRWRSMTHRDAMSLP